MDPRGIAHHHVGDVAEDGRSQFQALGEGLRCRGLDGVIDERPQVELHGFQPDVARFDARKVQNAVDHDDEALGIGLDDARYFALFRVECGCLQHVGHAGNAVQGRANLMAHVGQEFGLGRVGFDGRPAGIPRGSYLPEQDSQD